MVVLPGFDPRVLGGIPAAEERSDAARHRRQVLSVTRALVAERGVEGLAMREVSGRCGVGVATVYRRFPSKAALLAALVLDAVQDLEARLQGRWSAGGRCLRLFLGEARATLAAQAPLLGGGDAPARPILAWAEAVLSALLLAEEGGTVEGAQRTARVLVQLLQPAYLARVPAAEAEEELEAVLLALRMRLR